jgi:hypothetical protein
VEVAGPISAETVLAFVSGVLSSFITGMGSEQSEMSPARLSINNFEKYGISLTKGFDVWHYFVESGGKLVLFLSE